MSQPHHFQSLTQRIFQLEDNNNLIPEAREFLLALHLQDLAKQEKQYLWVASSDAEVHQIYGRLQTWIHLLDLSSSLSLLIDKLADNNFQPLQRFHQQKVKLLIVAQSAFDQILPTPDEVDRTGFQLQVKQSTPLVPLFERLVSVGYEIADVVDRPNQVAKRGGIIDFFHPRRDLPTRVEFWGDEITSLRYFDPLTQRSLQTKTNKLDHIDIPALQSSDFHGSLQDYLSKETHLIGDQSVLETLESLKYHPRWKFLLPKLLQENKTHHQSFDLQAIPTIQGKLRDLYQLILRETEQGRSVFIVSNQAARLQTSFEEAQQSEKHTKLFAQKTLHPEQVHFIEFPENQTPVVGFSSDELNLSILTDYEIFGLVQARTSIAGYQAHYKNFLNSINLGDIVVHADHGICILRDTLTMEAAGMTREYLLLEFADEDKVYLPTAQMFKLSKYIGQDSDHVKLNKLGTKQWNKRRHKVEVDTARMAKDLVSLYAKRHLKEGFAFPADDYLVREFEASFPFLETPDQLKAINEIKADMESTKTMDRLVCGDVGFGKTEVAMRAAFKAVTAGKQVCFLSPTTILAEQHLETMKKRYHGFDIRVEMLSRFHTPMQNKQALIDLKAGQIDIIVGTHRLLSKDVKFKNLGLIVIDEEQRFGVKQKEHLKKLRTEVDILSLSATPIPRTLNLSLIGIRDLSMITTPPKGRRAVETIVAHYDDHLIRQSIERELDRKGQVFVVYNRVASLDAYAQKIIELIPNVRITTAHGQLDPDQLEEKMFSFVHGKVDILVSSTIVENGVDIPNANTIIVIGAEDFGLASLYQLRGRVGRSDRQGYAYFLHKRHELSTVSWHRLKALQENSHLGAGMSLAMRDLEIRGAGNILGVDQSGHIDGVGFELYSRLLKRAIETQKKVVDEDADHFMERKIPLEEVTVDLPLSAFLPDGYVQSKKEKMVLYQRFAELETEREMEELQEELLDRFGQLPTEVQNMFKLLSWRMQCAEVGIEKVGIFNGLLCFDTVIKTPSQHLSTMIKIHADFQIEKQQFRVSFKKLGTQWQEVVKKVVGELGT